MMKVFGLKFKSEEKIKACEEKHTGVDGKSIFWPEAKILVEVNAIKECL